MNREEQAQAKAEYAEWMVEREERARARFCRCPECGSIEGLEKWERSDFDDYGLLQPEDGDWYAPDELCDYDAVYRPCWACRGEGAPDDMRRLTHDEVLDWLEGA